MRLLAHMRDEGTDDGAMAEMIGDCTAHAVRKWKYGERDPDPATMLKIEQITSGRVTLRDWAEQAAERAERRAAPQPTEPEAA